MLVLMTATDLALPARRIITQAGHDLRLLDPHEDLPAQLRRILATEPVAAVISRSLPLDAAHIASCPTLRIISRHGVGYDNVDLAAASAAGIPVTIAEAANAQSVAEMAMGLIFAVARQIPTLDQSIRQGAWDRASVGLELQGRRLGIVAYGAIGRRLAAMGHAMGLRIHAYDPFAARDSAAIWHDDLHSLLAQSDILSLHSPLTTQTRGMIGARELACLPEGAVVINTARGGLIDEKALAAALDSGHLFGAGLDTFATEPLPADHPLRHARNLVMTPHMGGSTRSSLDSVALSAARNVLAMLDGAGPDPRLVVNPDIFSPAP